MTDDSMDKIVFSKPQLKRWLVELTDPNAISEDVGAYHIGIEQGGALAFYDKDYTLMFAYGAGQWKNVSFSYFEDDEEDNG